MTQKSSFKGLPVEILLVIFEHLSFEFIAESLIAFASVNRYTWKVYIAHQNRLITHLISSAVHINHYPLLLISYTASQISEPCGHETCRLQDHTTLPPALGTLKGMYQFNRAYIRLLEAIEHENRPYFVHPLFTERHLIYLFALAPVPPSLLAKNAYGGDTWYGNAFEYERFMLLYNWSRELVQENNGTAWNWATNVHGRRVDTYMGYNLEMAEKRIDYMMWEVRKKILSLVEAEGIRRGDWDEGTWPLGYRYNQLCRKPLLTKDCAPGYAN